MCLNRSFALFLYVVELLLLLRRFVSTRAFLFILCIHFTTLGMLFSLYWDLIVSACFLHRVSLFLLGMLLMVLLLVFAGLVHSWSRLLI